MRLKFSQNCPCISSTFQNYYSLQKKKVSANISCWVYYCGIVPSWSIKLCRLHHLLSSVLIHDMSLQLSLDFMQKEGMVIWENKISPLLSVGGNTQRKRVTRKTNAGGSHLLSQSWDHKEAGEGSAFCLIHSIWPTQNRSEQVFRKKK